MTSINRNILATLAYFDMFSYPLTRVEILLYLQQKYYQPDVDAALRYMVASRAIYRFGDYYTLRNDPTLISRRITGNRKAGELIKIAHRVSDLLIRFPYVRGIAISGSLSKNYADDESDVDLFIITAKNRLWIARSFMHLLKKLSFLFNKQHYFCMNYYVDEEQLEITEKNIYTAIEVVTLMPLQGDSVFESFYAENTWTQVFLPNNYLRVSTAKPVKTFWLKSAVEFLLNSKLGCMLDRMLMRITSKKWQKKTQEKATNMHGFVLGMIAEQHCSKPDPINFQKHLLNNYNNKVHGVLESTEHIVAN
ncbi:hypothetical protein C8P68_106341 [Mucilaginibacter yixingensis]|uniref:Nucleotidyltransferase-like protein n=1 Tax=Mucilaginibacter yixingensis TaxID=1295612 RepID=A0A2T5J7R6_9SPHI|nr:hypothetical protein [Mucilaginibacter yixingensis]PTQ95126.1 hypothetical protein C8P68_106341 [Mucilaginibacter yixingensis]